MLYPYNWWLTLKLELVSNSLRGLLQYRSVGGRGRREGGKVREVREGRRSREGRVGEGKRLAH